ncbi:MAG TPA: ATP-binding protein [Symbiobacteriaceae bacterium]|nr:ATP-binding protein [Symbiobacteriaceae bacterium]
MTGWWNRLRVKVLLFGVVMSVVPLSLFGWYGLASAQGAQADVVAAQNLAAAQAVAEQVSRSIRQATGQLELLARLEGSRLTRQVPAEQERVLYTLLRDLPYLEDVALADGRGRELGRASRRDVVTGATPREYGGMPLWDALVSGGGGVGGSQVLGPVTLDLDGRPLVSIGVILPGGAGALLARASLRSLAAEIAGGDARIQITDEAGRLIGATDFSLVLAGARPSEPPADPAQSYRSATGEFVLGVGAAVPGLPWRVVAETPLSVAMAPVKHLAVRFGVGAAVLMIVIIILSVVFGLQLTVPLERLEAGARQVGAGDLTVRVPEGGRDELGRLVHSFNAMTAQLHEDQRRRRAMELIVRQSEKLVAVGQLAAGVAHEINNPLAVISAYAEDLGDRLNEEGAAALEASGDLAAYLAQLRGQVQRCKGITANLLDFARRGPAEPQLEPVDVAGVAQRTVELVLPRARQAGIAVTVEAEEDLPSVRATRDLLQQVFLNLITNSLDALEERGGGHVTVTVSRGGMTVADDGPGMDEATLPRAMEPFFTTKPPGKGTGLGLSTCYGIITGLGGNMVLQSRPGAGTVVFITLPEWGERDNA